MRGLLLLGLLSFAGFLGLALLLGGGGPAPAATVFLAGAVIGVAFGAARLLRRLPARRRWTERDRTRFRSYLLLALPLSVLGAIGGSAFSGAGALEIALSFLGFLAVSAAVAAVIVSVTR